MLGSPDWLLSSGEGCVTRLLQWGWEGCSGGSCGAWDGLGMILPCAHRAHTSIPKPWPQWCPDLRGASHQRCPLWPQGCPISDAPWSFGVPFCLTAGGLDCAAGLARWSLEL